MNFKIISKKCLVTFVLIIVMFVTITILQLVKPVKPEFISADWDVIFPGQEEQMLEYSRDAAETNRHYEAKAVADRKVAIQKNILGLFGHIVFSLLIFVICNVNKLFNKHKQVVQGAYVVYGICFVIWYFLPNFSELIL